ncbi:MAG: hypothetical protein IJ864_01820 [Alphaproteobacteria bacterium]|nr:hypothetical protein [Alphaproteobacteria bacterium]
MLVHVPDHFSTKLRFNLNKLPAVVTDRSSVLWGLLGFFSGILMLWLGIFELLSFLHTPQQDTTQSFLLLEFFAFIVILISLILISYSGFSFFRYKKFYFDGKEFQMIYRPSIGVKHKFCEPLENYIGVRLRILFVQSGLFNKNRYIIDLYHPDRDKIIPLYISTHAKNIRKIWESYARMFRLPALSIGDRGLVQRDYRDLDKSIKTLAEEGKLPFIAGGNFPAPESLIITEQANKTIIRSRGFYWDAFSATFLFLIFTALFCLLAGAVYFVILGAVMPFYYWLLGGLLFVCLLYFAVRLFSHYTIIINKLNLQIIEQAVGMIIHKGDISVQQIENVELSFNPTSGRYSLAVISDNSVLSFGSRLPVADLLWLKDFVIRKLIGN